jgi:hypothetical protein
MAYKEVFQWLVDIGLVEVLLPFLLVYTIVFAVLQRTQVFGVEGKKPKTKLNAMVAFVMGFFAVLATNLLNIINIILFYFVLLIVIGLLLALILGISGAEVRSRLYIGVMLFFAGLFLFFGLAKAGVIDENAFWTGFVIPMLILGAIVYGIFYLFKEKKPKPQRQQAQRQPQQAPQRTQQGPSQQELEQGAEELLRGLPPEAREALSRTLQRQQRERNP